MKAVHGLLLAGIIASNAQAQGEITVPWEEFQQLYRQQLQSELQPERPAPVSVVHQLNTVLALSAERVVARITLGGEVRGADPEPLPLFDADLAVLGVEAVMGGVLAAGETGFAFHPDAEGPFELTLTAALPVQRDRRSAFVAVAMPAAVRHELMVSGGDDYQILEAPGIQSGEGRYALRPNESLRLRFARMEANAEPVPVDLPEVDTAALVLEEVDFSTAYSDNGNAFSTLRLKLPAEAGRQLRLPAIPGAEVWSVRVGDEPARLLRQDDEWVIPLPGESTTLLLSFLRGGERLGLSGRLEFPIPALGLPAREARITVGLAGRLDLVALEGELEPAPGGGWTPPPGFSGKAYRFRYPYYRGEALAAAIYYEEPVSEDKP